MLVALRAAALTMSGTNLAGASASAHDELLHGSHQVAHGGGLTQEARGDLTLDAAVAVQAGPRHLAPPGSDPGGAAAVARWKQVIGDGLRSPKDERRATEVDVAVHARNRMPEFRRPISVRFA